MANRKTLNLAAGAATLGAWVWLGLYFQPRPPVVDVRPHVGVGEVLAAQAVKLLEPGARIIVIARDTAPFQVPASTAQLEGFQAALKRSGHTAAVLKTYKMDPLRVVRVPSEDFCDLLRKGRDNDVIVSFLGPPILSAEQLAKIGDKRPRVLAVCAGTLPAQVSLKSLFNQKLLSAAIVSRNDAPARAVSVGSRSAFDQLFVLVTPENVSEIALAGN